MKYIKFLSVGLLVSTLIMVGTVGSGIVANATVNEDDADILFSAAIQEVFDYENVADVIVRAKKEKLYDIHSCELGLQYSFTYGDKEGFALLIDDGKLQLTELFMEATAPFQGQGDKNVYISQGVYWYSDGNDFYDCITGLQISKSSVELLEQTAYKGVTELTYESETVNYTYRSEAKYVQKENAR